MVDELLAEQTELAEQPDGDAILYIEQGGVQYHIQASNLLLGTAPAAQYVTLATDSVLDNERVLTAGTGVTITDGGAGSTVTLATNDSEIDHGGLGGLADDDHTQYLLLAGETTDAKLYSGADLIVYSDAGTTEVARIDGATGAITAAPSTFTGSSANILIGDNQGRKILSSSYIQLQSTGAQIQLRSGNRNFDFVNTVENITATMIVDSSGTIIFVAGFNTNGGVDFRSKGTGDIGFQNEDALDIMYIDTTAVSVGIGLTGPLGKLHIDQLSTTAAIPVLVLDQADISEGFINFVGTSAASAAGPISTWTAGNSIQGFVRVEINGTGYWMPYYDNPTS